MTLHLVHGYAAGNDTQTEKPVSGVREKDGTRYYLQLSVRTVCWNLCFALLSLLLPVTANTRTHTHTVRLSPQVWWLVLCNPQVCRDSFVHFRLQGWGSADDSKK